MKQNIAVLFDMDGVLVDNHEFHYQSWVEFCKAHDISMDREKFLTFFGSSSKETIEGLFGRELPDKLIKDYASEKEEIYRKLFKPHIKLVRGLKEFLDDLKNEGIETAIATSAPLINAKFVVNETGIEEMFKTIVHDAHFQKGKPDPEVYLKAAGMLGYKPSNCLVFEDSVQGIEAAQRAGMRVVGVATTNPPEKINHTHKVIRDFTEITLEDVYAIMA
ncbi:MAG: HAD family phosphatase [Bacteroidales bacterium]|nr:HAD family phosphatase [Bacteroidales bacterium]